MTLAADRRPSLPGRRSERKATRSRRAGGGWRPYAALAPLVVLLVVFLYGPVAAVCGLSFFEWNLVDAQPQFVGLKNFDEFVHDPATVSLLAQTVGYVVAALVGNFLLPVGLAMLTLRLRPRAATLYRTLLFAPAVVSTSIGAVLWQFVYLPRGGPLNQLLEHVHLPAQNWLNDPNLVLPSVATAAVWNTFGFSYIIALGGLSSIPKEQLEAAHVDGARGWALLRYVVIPLLKPTLLFLGITAVLQAMPNSFVALQVLTAGGPDGRSEHLLYDVYLKGFQFFQVGQASTVAIVLMILISGLAVWQFRLLDRRVDYDH
ncbi:carbohydrate ABC transporter permease [Nocardia sp. NPDC059239]|uniref:carbohydrate ABC transporter permease n=1 Tax=Nocardia sp. NPDC059239 TaxID=3346785 RepID=UPI0036991045